MLRWRHCHWRPPNAFSRGHPVLLRFVQPPWHPSFLQYHPLSRPDRVSWMPLPTWASLSPWCVMLMASQSPPWAGQSKKLARALCYGWEKKAIHSPTACGVFRSMSVSFLKYQGEEWLFSKKSSFSVSWLFFKFQTCGSGYRCRFWCLFYEIFLSSVDSLCTYSKDWGEA